MTEVGDGEDLLRPLRERIIEPRNLTMRQVANRSGLPVAELREIYAALGISEEELHGESAVEEAVAVRVARGALPLPAVVRLARARRMAASQVAAADVAAVRHELLVPLRDAGVDVPAVLVDSATRLWPMSTQLFANAHRRALERLLSLSVAADAVREPEAGLPLAVGFVDVVGYTRFSAMVDPEGLTRTLEAFEQHVLAAASRSRELSVPKFIGDAAMLVATDTVLLADALLDVVEAVPELAETPLRAGMSAGEILPRGGDYFGPPVNLAARLTDYARPQTVLADEDLRTVLEPHFSVRRISRLRLHGIGIRRPLVVRRPEAAEG
ncbi:MAG TPA: adenylate/guanylate cyclase domain-containing protein [Egibacteraceae bacterium]|nr:adenylate/guanylate cyclase domain-containing protein [Egibacteraceae bacterium]